MRPSGHILTGLALAGLAAGSLASGAPDPGRPATRPNVVLILTDDQGYGDLSCHGNPVLKTPHLDRLHAESVRLTNFHVAPMCTPTRGQLLTGCDALRNGAMNVSSGRTLLRREFPTMADAFRAAGYRTGQFGKWHLGDNTPYRPHERGFDEAVYFPSSHIGSAPDFWNNDYFDDHYRRRNRIQPYEGYCTDVFFAEAGRWIRAQAAARRPFFAYIATNAPHGPLFVPQRYREPYAGRPRNLASFFGMIANIDENVGKLDRLLADAGVREDTLLVFLTDNGGTAGVNLHNAGMRGRKIDLYDGGHRVPCFLRWAAGGLRPATDVADLTQVQDLFPTLVELCRLPRPRGPEFDGISLAERLRGAGQARDRTLFVQFSRMNDPKPRKGDAAVLTARWRLVGGTELYDIQSDPGQAKDVAAAYPEIVQRLRLRYERWWAGLDGRVDEHSAINLGSPTENPLTLSPADWEDSFLDQGRQVREGLRRSGSWNVDIQRSGRYRFTLRRWPVEAGAAIRDGLPPYQGTDGVFPAGVALPVASARLRVAGVERSSPVGPADREIGFTLPLAAGRTRVEADFLDAGGQLIAGAYFVMVRRL